MVVLKDTDCYMWRITDNERKNIHTDAGLRAVEVSYINVADIVTRTEPPLPWYYQYFLGVNMSCSRTQHGDPSGARTPDLWIRSPMR